MVSRSRTWKARPRRVWQDPRFVGGLVLVALSVLVCTWLVTDARSGDALYRTTRAVAAGETLGPANTEVVEARPASDAYLASGELPDGALTTRSLALGELVPSSAVVTAEDGGFRRLMVTVSDGLPDSAGPGSPVELWFVPTHRNNSGEDTAPRLVAERVVLVRALEDTSSIASLGGTRIEVRLEDADLPAVLEATGGDGTLTAVPVGS